MGVTISVNKKLIKAVKQGETKGLNYGLEAERFTE